MRDFCKCALYTQHFYSAQQYITQLFYARTINDTSHGMSSVGSL